MNKMKNFNYLGLNFKPLRNLKGKSALFENVSQHLNNFNDTPKGWDYDEFYKKAGKAGAVVDLFEVSGQVRIPASNYLFHYIN